MSAYGVKADSTRTSRYVGIRTKPTSPAGSQSMVGRLHDRFVPLNDIIFGCHNSGTVRDFELIKAKKMVQIEHMELRATITAATFAAYLKCPTKVLLSAHGERPSGTFFDRH